jgi:DNA-binding transcriptional ArsR family regulator
VPDDLDLRALRELYRALGDVTRLRMIALLASDGPLQVTELSRRIGLSQPLISWHLRILRVAGVITTERHGREVMCRLRPRVFDELHAAEARLVAGERPAQQGGYAAGDMAEEVPDVG